MSASSPPSVSTGSPGSAPQSVPAAVWLARFETDAVPAVVAAMIGADATAGPGVSCIAAADEIDRLALTDLPRALTLLPRLIEAARALPSAGPALTRVLRSSGQALTYANRFADAAETFSQAISAGEEAGAPVEAAMARNTSIHVLCRLGRLDEAIAAGEAAYAVFSHAGRADLAARADVNTGVAHRMADRPERAIVLFERALPAFAQAPVIAAQIRSNLAEALLDLGRFSEAQGAFESALAAFDVAGVRRAAAIVRGNLADLAGRQGRLHIALDLFERARRELDESGAPGDAARRQVEQAEVLASLGLYAQASEALAAAGRTLAEHTMPAEQARALLTRGRVLLRLGRPEQAIEQLVRARALFESQASTTGQGRAFAALAAAALHGGDTHAATEHAVQALDLLAGRPADEVHARLVAAAIAERCGTAADFSLHAAAALQTARRLQLPHLLTDALCTSAQVAEREGRFADAAALLGEACEGIERVRGSLPGERFRAVFLGDHAAVFARAASISLRAGHDPAFAFSFIERGRARALLESITSLASDVGAGAASDGPAVGDAALLTRLAAERAALAALYSGLERDASNETPAGAPQRFAEWQARIAKTERATDDLEQRLAATGGFAGAFAQPCTLAQFEAALAPGEAAIEFFEHAGVLSAIVVRPGGVTVVESLGPVAGVGTALAAFSFQVARAIARGMPSGEMGDRLAGAAEQALGALLAPIVDHLRAAIAGASTLVIIPTGVLASIPWAGLPLVGVGSFDGAGHGVAVTLVPSASIFVRLRQARAARSGDDARSVRRQSLVVGIADAAAPNAEREAALIAASLEDVTLLLGAQATRGAFAEAARTSHRIHLATHARFIASEPMASGIKLADGWLTTRDLGELNLAGADVILSACETGRAAGGQGEEVLGLSRGLLVAGAGSLVLSNWAVHDESTYELMAALYKIIESESNPVGGSSFGSGGSGSGGSSSGGLASALMRAMGRVRVTRPHPAAWAPFACFGLP